LFDVAERIQLPLTDYRLADQHYGALAEYIQRDGSSLRGLVTKVYPQGSVAIGSVVSSKFDTDEFDVDAIVELGINSLTSPAKVLNELYATINGEHGSRYYGKVTRRTRCVTVDFDNMHVDLTPAVLLNSTPRISHIFHAHERAPQSEHAHVVANPYGFVEWFKKQMPAAQMYVEDAMRKNTEPLPNKSEVNQKATPLIALQLIKRWRNKCYKDRTGTRCPPSIMLSFFAANKTSYQTSLSRELAAQAATLLQFFNQCDDRGELIEVRNPMCRDDIFTDRWPQNLTQQKQFTSDLKILVASMAKLEASPTPEVCSKVMAELFGERPIRDAMDALNKRYAEKANTNGLLQYAGTGAVALSASGVGNLLSSATTYAAPRSTNFGSD
jgi:Second Messenger Oligonucleotide or Dinucleotide Synthetase domain